MRNWKIERKGGKYLIQHGMDFLLLTEARMTTTICEWKQWERYYLPHSSLSGKTVLDVGAGCGETAYFYLLHGAKEVIAVEIDPIQIELLEKNSEINGWDTSSRVRIIPRAFEVDDLAREQFDFAKVDIEGGEAALLKLDRIDFPMVMEVHSKELRDQLVQKFGLSILGRAIPLEDVWLLGNRSSSC